MTTDLDLTRQRGKTMLDVRIVLDDVPEYVFRACGATTQDERDTISACVRTYARDCIAATLLTIEDGPVFKDAWRYRVMVENGVVPSEWHEIISADAMDTASALMLRLTNSLPASFPITNMGRHNDARQHRLPLTFPPGALTWRSPSAMQRLRSWPLIRRGMPCTVRRLSNCRKRRRKGNHDQELHQGS